LTTILKRTAALLCLWALLSSPTYAQEVLAPPSSPPTTPQSLQGIEIDRPGVMPGEQPSSAWQGSSPFRWGPVSVRPAVSYRLSHADEIRASTNRTSSSLVHEISPSLSLELGRYWAAGYQSTWTIYSSGDFHDTLNHSGTLRGNFLVGEWSLGLSQASQFTDDPILETGEQTRQHSHGTRLSAFHRFDEKLSCSLNLAQDLEFAEGFSDSRQWSTMDWVDYQLWPTFAAGLGAGVGYADVEASPDQLYEQVEVRVTWRMTRKFSSSVSGGVDFRQFAGSGASDDAINPIFSGSVQYAPTSVTTLSLSGSRAVNTSLFENQITESTGVRGAVTQRLLGRLMLTVEGSYQHVEYVASTANTAAGRVDNSFSVETRLSTTLLKRGTVTVFYRYSEDSSSQAGYDFSSDQVGLELRYGY
jgi:Putative beta-barrel porin 2